MARKNKGYPILAPLVPRTLVIASHIAVDAGWNEPERFRWPGEVVHEATTLSGKNVAQFLLWDKKEGFYVLKTWDKRYLALARQKDTEQPPMPLAEPRYE